MCPSSSRSSPSVGNGAWWKREFCRWAQCPPYQPVGVNDEFLARAPAPTRQTEYRTETMKPMNQPGVCVLSQSCKSGVHPRLPACAGGAKALDHVVRKAGRCLWRLRVEHAEFFLGESGQHFAGWLGASEPFIVKFRDFVVNQSGLGFCITSYLTKIGFTKADDANAIISSA